MRTTIAIVALILTVPAWARAQNGADPQNRVEGYSFFGVGPALARWPPSLPPPSRPVVEHVGLGAEVFLYKGLAVGPEMGYEHWGEFDQEAGIGSVDVFYHFQLKGSHKKVEPFALGGYTLKFMPHSYGNGANLGGGVNLWLAKHAALRMEIRDEAGLHVSPNGWQETLEFCAGITIR